VLVEHYQMYNQATIRDPIISYNANPKVKVTIMGSYNFSNANISEERKKKGKKKKENKK